MLKQRITDDMKAAMKAGQKARLGTVRLILAAIKQREVDERIELSDEDVLAVLEKMIKQRRDSIDQYRQAGRQELAAQEQAEIDIIQEYLPEALPEDVVAALVEQAVAATGAVG
ncbi:MAG: GatB/YqeY domain-containing protein, partial [Gammaproteobacteria bacterium]